MLGQRRLGHGADQQLVRHDRVAHEAAVALDGQAAVPEPVGRGEVDRLRAVEAVVEAAVVGAREGHHELAGRLHGVVHGHALGAQPGGVDHGDQVQQEVWLPLHELRRHLARRALERGAAVTRHAPPRLGSARVVVADGGEVVVLVVPAEARVHHAYVQPRRRDT
jgi:hypothetical protein